MNGCAQLAPQEHENSVNKHQDCVERTVCGVKMPARPRANEGELGVLKYLMIVMLISYSFLLSVPVSSHNINDMSRKSNQ